MSDNELDDVWAAIDALREEIEQLQEEHMSTQADVDADTAAIAQAQNDLATSVATIQAELNALAAQNPSLNISALTGAIATLDPAAKAVGALVPAGATGPTGATGVTGPTGAPTGPTGTPVALFSFSGDPTATVDPAVWALSPSKEPSGQALYTLVPGVTQPTDPAWASYTGPTV
jgi:prefoldin subunit 5